MPKKDFKKSTETAVEKFFFNDAAKAQETANKNDVNNDNVINITNETNVTNNTNNTHNTNKRNKSKHFDERGSRSERYGLLMDKQLRDDLTKLCSATGGKSLNDFIVTILVDYTETPANQKRLKAYDELLNL